MTTVCEEFTMTLAQAPPTLRKLRWREERREYDALQLCTALRKLALRAYQLVRATDEPGWEPRPGSGSDLKSDLERELTELHAQIVQLHQNLHAQNLYGLATYVSALQRKVEESLAGASRSLITFADPDFS